LVKISSSLDASMETHNTADDNNFRETVLVLKSQDHRAARRRTEADIALNPKQEEPWITLGILATPHASVFYMKKALEINPESGSAQAGLRWAMRRLQKANTIQTLDGMKTTDDTPAPSRSSPSFIKRVGAILAALCVVGGLVSVDSFWKADAASVPMMSATSVEINSASAGRDAYSAVAAFIPTETLVPSETPAPTATEIPTPTEVPTPTAQPFPTAEPPKVVAIPNTPVPLSGAKAIVVILSQQRLYAYQGESLVYNFIVSTGGGGGTAVGNFRILDKVPKPFSDPWGFWMPYWMGIYYATPYLENGIHALPVLPGGKTIWGNTLGSPVSYGCIVLGTWDAQRLYGWANIGTTVSIRY
jgi:lipoprotein-anchoring transpeptidase ErfK/SrfK